MGKLKGRMSILSSVWLCIAWIAGPPLCLQVTMLASQDVGCFVSIVLSVMISKSMPLMKAVSR